MLVGVTDRRSANVWWIPDYGARSQVTAGQSPVNLCRRLTSQSTQENNLLTPWVVQLTVPHPRHGENPKIPRIYVNLIIFYWI